MTKLYLQSSSLHCRIKMLHFISKSETISLENWWDLLLFEIGLKQAIKLYLCKPHKFPSMHDTWNVLTVTIVTLYQTLDDVFDNLDRISISPHYFHLLKFISAQLQMGEGNYIGRHYNVIFKKSSLVLFMILEKIPACTCLHLFRGLI